ncbi:ATP-binding protein [Evansella tamaricis]|uniref:MEDS domain-containing protein n=1 Tax=Evansella tamaricis TaxID=2069301 RepID=A0ABS6JJZ1_9BACI|nr:ATP-binding protein [Evansella tamaricis]MBU9714002.1 MEDS domain-containing protein [Evansella tamaricis]
MNHHPVMRLNNNIDVSNGGHILYSYENDENYLNNAISYIIDGIEHDQEVIVIDNLKTIHLLQKKLSFLASSAKLERVHYIDNFTYYQKYGDFCCESTLSYFSEYIEPFQKSHRQIRTWARVQWKEEADIHSKLIHFEHLADHLLTNISLLCVCAYNGNTLPASLLTSLMTHHEYLMTDEGFPRSTLYQNSEKNVVFPSISKQHELQSEVDLYKRKLDFIHVVSHEVRNPLTVIKAYASLILSKEPGMSQETYEQIYSIHDYIDVIDHEISHIIHTEQMLSSETLWEKENFDAVPILRSVLEFMEVKARTQNVTLISDMKGLPYTFRIINNKIGLRLILSNLLSNAIKYSEEQSEIRFTASQKNKRICFTIKDHGVGMTKDQLSKLFQKYGKTNQDKEGQGIGLYMVKKLVDHSNGNISIKSEHRIGTEITVTLPVYCDNTLNPITY